MSEQRTGKVTAEIFEQVILRRLGARDSGVVVGPWADLRIAMAGR